jgi:uncharacterized protein YndB with AHSA1/START domain
MTDQNAAEHELSITRSIHASPEIIYKVWTERIGEWWRRARGRFRASAR